MGKIYTSSIIIQTGRFTDELYGSDGKIEKHLYISVTCNLRLI